MKKAYSKPLQKKDLSLKGWNWGTVEFQGKYEKGQVSTKKMIKIWLLVSRVTIKSKFGNQVLKAKILQKKSKKINVFVQTSVQYYTKN